MLPDTTWKEIPVFQIRLPSGELSTLIPPTEEYLFDRLRIGEHDLPVFSPEAALHLSKAHPIYVWSTKNICISGIRTLFILSNVIPTSKIKVGVLPSSITTHEAKEILLADIWLTGLAFSTKLPPASLFEAKHRMPKRLVRSLTPALDQKVADFANSVGVSTPTLYGLRKKLPENKA